MRHLIALACTAVLCVHALAQRPADPPPPRPDLTGAVTISDGTPVEGATVMIWTAGVKVGYSTYCPSCYADCGKHARTDAPGRFTIPDLDPDLLFRIVIVAENYRPTFVAKIDPAAGPITATIDPRPNPPPDSRSALRGRIVDADGRPVPHAVVSPRMVMFADGGGRGGAVEGLDPLAVTNERGEFILCYKDDFASMDLEFEARGFAKAQADGLAPGRVHTLTIHEGATITGRVIHNGEPVQGILVGTAQPNRIVPGYLGEHTIGTDKHGSFRFDNIPIARPGGGGSIAGPPDWRVWNVYAKMESIKDRGATTFSPVRAEKHGAEYEAPDVEIRPGLTLAGRIILSDGAPIPAGMRIAASCESAWDAQIVPIAPDGTFRFTNLPPDTYSIAPSIKGYFLSPKNPSLAWSLEGVLSSDTTDFLILMDPGQDTFEGRHAGKHRGVPLRSLSPADLPDTAKR